MLFHIDSSKSITGHGIEDTKPNIIRADYYYYYNHFTALWMKQIMDD